MASPLLAPYVGANSYSIVVLGLCKLWSDHLNAVAMDNKKEELQGKNT
jgi:hypothetical protein